MSHLCGCGIGKGDRNHLAGLVDLSQQAQKAARQQVRLARARRCLHKNGSREIEGSNALGLVGRRGLMWAIHLQPPHHSHLPRLQVGPGISSPEYGKEPASRTPRRSLGIGGDSLPPGP